MIPSELTNRKQWLIWRFEKYETDKKPRKVPYYASDEPKKRHGKQGSDSDRAGLVTYDEAISLAEKHKFEGVGFAFLPDDGLIGIDLDGCFNLGDDEREKRARGIISACNSYTEYSPSGNGVHIICYGKSEARKGNHIGVEIFCGNMFLTFTGKLVEGTPPDINKADDGFIQKLLRTIKEKDANNYVKSDKPTYSVGADANDIEQALSFIPADCGYSEWIEIGMAIHSELGPSGYDLWDRWSATAPNYPGGNQTKTHYKSFKAGGIGIGTLFHIAKTYGYKPKKSSTKTKTQKKYQVDENTGEILIETSAVQLSTRSAVDFFTPLPFTNDKGNPLAHLENLREILRRLQIVTRYNVMTKKSEIIIPGVSYSIDNTENSTLTWLKSECSLFRFQSNVVREFTDCIADENPYNPVTTWILSKPHDGVSRMEAMLNTIACKNPADNALKESLMRKWFVSAVAAAFTSYGISASGMLVLQGDQGLGKTKWFKALVPSSLDMVKDGFLLNPANRDSVRQASSFWLVELGELDATFRKSDIAALKAFITQNNDLFRKPYAEKDSTFPRKTVFFGSVNDQGYLSDPTGNRRFWTVACESIDHEHGIDMQQFWAEVYALFLAGESYHLDDADLASVNLHNENFTDVEPIEEMMMEAFDMDEPKTLWKKKTATQIYFDLGLKNEPTKKHTNKISNVCRKLKFEDRKSGSNRFFVVPPMKK